MDINDTIQRSDPLAEVRQKLIEVTQNRPVVELFGPPSETTNISEINPIEHVLGDLRLDGPGLLVEKFFQFHRFGGDIIEAYDNFVYSELRDILRSRQLIIRQRNNVIGYVYVDHPYPVDPMIRDDANRLIPVQGPPGSKSGPGSGPGPGVSFERRPLTPDICRNEHRTYSTKITAKVYFYRGPFQTLPEYTEGIPGLTFTLLGEIDVMELPIMLGSKLDIVSQATDPYDKMRLGECPFDPLGYFIINGSERRLVSQEGLRTGMIHAVLGDPKVDKLIAKKGAKPRMKLVIRMTTATLLGSNVFKLFENTDSRIDVLLRTFGNDPDDKPISLTSYSVIRMLASYYFEKLNREITQLRQQDKIISREMLAELTFLQNCQQISKISELICSFTRPEWTKKVYLKLIPSVDYATSIGDDYVYLHNLQQGRNPTRPLTDEIRQDRFTILDNLLFPHMNKEPASLRIQLLALMTCQMAETLGGLRDPDDRDAWYAKRLYTAAVSISTLMMGCWKKFIDRLQIDIDTQDIKLDLSAFSNPSVTGSTFGASSGPQRLDLSPVMKAFQLCYRTISDNFIKCFSGNQWGVDGSKAKENISDSVKRDSSIVSIYSETTRISSQTNKKIKVTSLRMIASDSYGYVDPVESPEGSSCFKLSTPILMANGRYRQIGELKDGDEIVTYNPDTNTLTTTKIHSYFQKPAHQLLHIVAMNGYEVECTFDHPFLTNQGFIKAEDLDISKHQLYYYPINLKEVDETQTIIKIAIKSIEVIPGDIVADFTTEADTHTMISNGFVTHNCGIIKNRALMCIVSMRRPERPVLDKILPYISRFRTSQFETPCQLNGKFIGWCKGIELRRKCVEWRRKFDLPYDTCIALHKDVLLIHVDGSRLIRPLLIVNERSGRPRIEEDNKWNASWIDLLTGGYIEYIDALESHYIYIAESLNTLHHLHGELRQVAIRIRTTQMLIAQLREQIRTTSPETVASLMTPMEPFAEADSATTYTLQDQLKDAEGQLRKENINLAQLRRKATFTHCEIDPQAMLGLASSLGPSPNRNPGPRNSYQCLSLTEEILMADLTYKTMEQLRDGDQIMTYNLFTGQLEASGIHHKFIRNPEDYRVPDYRQSTLYYLGQWSSQSTSQNNSTGTNQMNQSSNNDRANESERSKPEVRLDVVWSIPKEYRIYQITTTLGHVIKCSGNHPFLTKQPNQFETEFVEAADLIPDLHRVAIYLGPDQTNSILRVEHYQEILECYRGPNKQCLYVPIKSIEELPIELVGDFTTDNDNHTMITRSGFITHNCGHLRQALGINHSLLKTRMDTTTKSLYQPTPAIYQTQMYRMIGFENLPAGDSVMMAIMTWSGFNQEDAIIMKQEFIDLGGYRSVKQHAYETVFKSHSGKFEEVLVNPIHDPRLVREFRIRDTSAYQALDRYGLPIHNAHVKQDDVIIGRVRYYPNSQNPIRIEDASTRLGVREEGYIDYVTVNENPDKQLIVAVRVRTNRMPKVGDKFCARNAQKGTLGRVLPASKLPWISSNNPRINGVTPDIIINPHAFPSRMTLSWVIEVLLSTIGSIRGQRMNATLDRPVDFNNLRQILRDYGMDDLGNMPMMDPETGKPLASQTPVSEFVEGVEGTEGLVGQIFVGVTYYQALKHFVDDKEQARSTGRYTDLLRQPVKGRGLGGGLKLTIGFSRSSKGINQHERLAYKKIC